MTKDENIQKAKELEIFEAYRKHIDEGRLQSFAVMDSDMINEELECICNAALLSRNTEAALNLTINLAGHKDRLTPENWAILNQTNERLKSLVEKGGWLPIIKDEDSEDTSPIEFPTGTFPSEIETYLQSVTEHIQVDSAMVLAAALGAFALCMQGKYRISHPSGNGHNEHLCLYIIIVADPGERKSAVFSAVNRPIREWQAEKRETYKLDLASYDTQKTILEENRNNLKKKISNKQLNSEQRSSISDELTAATADLESLRPPISPEIIATDSTVEALADLMQITGETAGVFSDEADFFKVIAGLYTGGGVGNLQLPLKAYDGSPFYLLRRGRTIGMQRPLLSICLMIQPSLFTETLGNDALKGRGMIGRLVTCTPKKMAGLRDVRKNVRLNEIAYQSYKEIMMQFLDADQKADADIQAITWESDAKEIMLDYLQTVENSMQVGCPMEEATDYASKAAGVAIRIAGILHMLWVRDERKPISIDTAKKAIAVHTYFFSEKLKDMRQDERADSQVIEKVKCKIKEFANQNCTAVIPARCIQQKMKGAKGLKLMEDFELIFEQLEEKNILQFVKMGNRKLLYISPYFL